MLTQLLSPNLPESPVKRCIVSCDISRKTEAALKSMGIECVKLCGHNSLPSEVRNHPDMNVLHIAEGEWLKLPNICTKSGEEIKDFTASQGEELKYPDDVKLNAAVVGRRLITNTKTVSKDVLRKAKEEGLGIIDVKQGYTKCNILVVDENSVITEDEGIEKAARENGMNVLLLKTHAVKLAGFDYGFIGGAGGKVAKDTLAFFGDITKHPEFSEIRKFLSDRGVKALSLSDEPLADYGSLLPLE